MDIKHNDEIEESLKFELGRFKDECIETYKTMIEANVKKTVDQITEKIDSKIRNNLSHKICGEDLYDYSNVPEVPKYPLKPELTFSNMIASLKDSLLNRPALYRNANINQNLYVGKQLDEEYELQKKYLKDIETDILMTKDDKIILYLYNTMDYKDKNATYKNQIYLTNKGKLLKILTIISKESWIMDREIYVSYLLRGCVNKVAFIESYENYNFDIPIDYYKILKLIFDSDYLNTTKVNSCVGNSLLNVLEEVLKYMKNTLYNRKFVPLYTKDIVKENDKLKSEYENFRKEKEEFNKQVETFKQEKKQFYDKYHDKLDVIKEREEIAKEKHKLRLVSMKLDYEKRKLEEDMTKINEEKRKLYSLNIDDILRK